MNDTDRVRLLHGPYRTLKLRVRVTEYGNVCHELYRTGKDASSLSRCAAQRPAASSTGDRASSAKVTSPRNRAGGTSRGQYHSLRRLRRSQRRGTSASIITTSCTRPPCRLT